MPALVLDKKGDTATDYELNEEYNSCWITVNNISVHVRRTDEGVAVNLYPAHRETEDSIAGTWASFTEVTEG